MKNIPKGTIIEVAPVIAIPKSDPLWNVEGLLDNYYLEWGDTIAMGLGFASLYNHSNRPNVERHDFFDMQVTKFVTIKNVEKDNEITIKYRCPPWWNK
jgi:SET domain-containing protein